jgi:hypothetical protein
LLDRAPPSHSSLRSKRRKGIDGAADTDAVAAPPSADVTAADNAEPAGGPDGAADPRKDHADGEGTDSSSGSSDEEDAAAGAEADADAETAEGTDDARRGGGDSGGREYYFLDPRAQEELERRVAERPTDPELWLEYAAKVLRVLMLPPWPLRPAACADYSECAVPRRSRTARGCIGGGDASERACARCAFVQCASAPGDCVPHRARACGA